MDENKKRIEKIYSRNRIKIPKVQFFFQRKRKDIFTGEKRESLRKISKILLILTIAFMVCNMLIKAIEPIMDKQCISMARAIASNISNKQATAVMADYKYEDLMNISVDENGNIKMISANVITVNKIISDIPVLIQQELDETESGKFYINLGSFTGSRMLAGRGPKVEIKMSTIGDIQTDLKSEFSSAGINQTIHRIYLEVTCNVVILTPFDTIEETIVNQVLLAEGVIVGNIPNTYYNLEGLNKNNLVDVIE